MDALNEIKETLTTTNTKQDHVILIVSKEEGTKRSNKSDSERSGAKQPWFTWLDFLIFSGDDPTSWVY